MKTLQELLGEELYNQVKEKLGDTKIIINDGSYIKKDSGEYVPRTRINELNEQHQQELEKRDNELTQLKEKVQGNEAALAQIGEMEQSNKELKDQAEKLSKENELIKQQDAVKEELRKAKCKFPDLMLPKFDYENIKQVGNKWIGITDQIDILKEDYKDAFGEVKVTGDDPGNPNNDNPTDKKFSELTLTERATLKKENPQKYEELRKKG